MSLLVELNKGDLIRLCMSLQVGKSYEEADYFTQLGAAHFSGNQHNENWSWNRDYFKRLTEQQLVTFFHNNK